MISSLRSSSSVLFVGDSICFLFALWAALFVRAFEVPTLQTLIEHTLAFLPLFVIWVLVYVIAGLYEGRRVIFARRSLLATLLYAQLANVIIAALFFFVWPLFGITPKTILFIYLIISFCLVLIWRVFLFPRFGREQPRSAIVIGDGTDLSELVEALCAAPRSPIVVVAVLSAVQERLAQRVRDAIETYRPQFIVADLDSQVFARDAMPDLYNLLSQGVRFIDAQVLHEEVFGRVPLSRVNDQWIVRNVSRYVNVLYDPIKRLIDIIGAIIIGAISLIAYPCIMLAIYAESGGPIFITQERVGEGNRTIRLYKFRTMTGNDNGVYQGGKSTLRVTKVGHLLRVSRLDELPQLWNVITGDLSLIGPRPEFPALVAQYSEAIPYYGLRHLIRPGLSGWAQLYHDNHPHHGTNVEATREKLSYDLYYLKHRSLVLDLLITLKTAAKLLTRSGV